MRFLLTLNSRVCRIPCSSGILFIAAALFLVLFPPLAAGQRILPDQFEEFQISLSPESCNCQLIPGDEMWVVNTRSIPESCNDCFGSVPAEVCQWSGVDWKRRTQDELFAAARTNPSLRNVVYIHGNFTDYGWSLRRGCEVYGSFFGNGYNRPPLRFVIWSWKSERETAFCQDYFIKSHRAVEEGCRLNSVVSQLGPTPPLVIGYSLGAQAVLSALAQPDPSTEMLQWRVALIAVALDVDFPPQLVGNLQITNRLEQLVVFTNARDPALKSSNRLARRRTHSTPFSQYELLPNLPDGSGRFSQFEVGPEIGRHQDRKSVV
jgi:pimeloyl-ACP methyl ester carboxylesterase